MPPEVMVANPKYDTSVDEFSYGALMIHILSGRWPEPQIGQVKLEEGKLVPVSEVERREVFLQVIGNDHPLMDLIRKCIDNDPSRRVPAKEIVKIIAALVVPFPTTFENRLEMLRHARVQDEKIRSLSEQVDQKAGEIEHLAMLHASEIEALQLRVKNFDSDGTLMREEKIAEVEELQANVVLYEAQLERTESTLKQHKIQQEKEREEFDIQLNKERQASEKLSAENLDLYSEVTKLIIAINSAQSKISSLEVDVTLKDFTLSQKDASLKRSYAEISANSKAIQSKDTIISRMEEQLARVREYLATKRQVKLTWLAHRSIYLLCVGRIPQYY
jgi:serine/threonine protein kinase